MLMARAWKQARALGGTEVAFGPTRLVGGMLVGVPPTYSIVE